jgi:uncharacterized protein YecT (DUF1311 family)
MKTFFSVLVLVFSVSAFSNPCTRATTNAELNQCETWNLLKADDQLNANYQKLLKSLNQESAQQLKTAQRAWMAYRDANCLYYAVELNATGGSILRELSCKVQMTKQRARELKENLQERSDR